MKNIQTFVPPVLLFKWRYMQSFVPSVLLFKWRYMQIFVPPVLLFKWRYMQSFVPPVLLFKWRFMQTAITIHEPTLSEVESSPRVYKERKFAPRLQYLLRLRRSMMPCCFFLTLGSCLLRNRCGNNTQ